MSGFKVGFLINVLSLTHDLEANPVLPFVLLSAESTTSEESGAACQNLPESVQS